MANAPASGSRWRLPALGGLLLALATAWPGGAAAEVVLGLRAGVAVPFGDVAASGGGPLADELRLALPLQLDLGVGVAPALQLGLYGQWAPAAIARSAPLGSGACVGFGASCSGASSWRLGVAVEYRISSAPWIGAALGYGWTGYDFRDAAGKGSLAYQGFELALQGGADFAVATSWTIGPLAAVTLGRFDRVSASQAGQTASGSIADKAVHGWLQAGVRVRFTR